MINIVAFKKKAATAYGYIPALLNHQAIRTQNAKKIFIVLDKFHTQRSYL